MAQYAYYDSTQPAPSPVLGWYDLDLISYQNLPSSSDLLQITSDEWAARMDGQWAVSAGALAAYTPPAPILTAQQQLAQQAAALIAGGITITSTGTPALNGVYAAGTVAQANMAAVVGYINANQSFPGTPGTTMPWYDAAGQVHVFPSVAEFMALYTAGFDFVLDCQLIVDAGTGTLPPAEATIP